MSIGIITIILVGIKRFEKIDDLLHAETKLAQVIGLKRFFDKTYAITEEGWRQFGKLTDDVFLL